MSITPTHRSITVGTGCFVVSRGLHHKLEQGVLGWEGSPFLHVCSNPVQDHKWHITYNINVHCTSDQYCYPNCYQVVNAVTFNHQSTNLRRRGEKNIILLNTSTAADQSYDLECVYNNIREKDVITCGWNMVTWETENSIKRDDLKQILTRFGNTSNNTQYCNTNNIQETENKNLPLKVYYNAHITFNL